MFFPVTEWFPAFILTLAVEAPIVWVLLRAARPDPLRFAVLFVFANLATHLTVWFVFTQLFLIGTAEYTLAAESWAIAAETLFYAAAIPGITARGAFTVATAANLASFLAGRVLVVLWPDSMP